MRLDNVENKMPRVETKPRGSWPRCLIIAASLTGFLLGGVFLNQGTLWAEGAGEGGAGSGADDRLNRPVDFSKPVTVGTFDGDEPSDLVVNHAGLAEADSETTPFGWEHMFAMLRMSDPQPSPDGTKVLFSVTRYDVEANRSRTDLALVDLPAMDLGKGGRGKRKGKVETGGLKLPVGPDQIRFLTNTEGADYNGRWDADGRSVLFLSTRSGSSQVWRLPVAGGGEPVQVTHLPVAIEGFELSPNGERLLFWSRVFPTAKTLAQSAAMASAQENAQATGRIFENTFIRHWDTWKDGTRNQLFVLSLDGSGTLVNLTPGWDQDTPTVPWGGTDEFAWSPDGKQIAFSSKVSTGEPWHTNSDIWLVDVDGDGTKGQLNHRLLTGENQAWDTQPLFSPDGTKLAYLAMDRPGFESDRLHLVVMDLQSGKKNHLTGKWDRSISQFAWSGDGKTLYAVAQEHARNKIFSVDSTSGQVKALVEVGSNSSLALAGAQGGQDTLVFLRDRMTHPREMFRLYPASGKVEQVTYLNKQTVESARMAEPEEFWFDHDGYKLHGWLLRPVDFQNNPGAKYPLAFMIHGGPQGSWGDDFHYRWNPQFYAGAGYVTVMVDFRGSTGYGQEFTDAIRTNWGPGPYSDLMAGLKHVLANYDFIDQDRMCALGASYGGYMINWIAGQDYAPFKCLINHSGDFDLVSAYYTTEELWFPEWELKGTPWTNRAMYDAHSPSQFVHKWRIPMLVIQGAKDFRVVETESISTFNALQRLGIPSKFLYFPDENHWIMKPANSRLWHQTVLDWMNTWTGQKQ